MMYDMILITVAFTAFYSFDTSKKISPFFLLLVSLWSLLEQPTASIQLNTMMLYSELNQSVWHSYELSRLSKANEST